MVREPTVYIPQILDLLHKLLSDAEQHYGKPNGRMNEKNMSFVITFAWFPDCSTGPPLINRYREANKPRVVVNQVTSVRSEGKKVETPLTVLRGPHGVGEYCYTKGSK